MERIRTRLTPTRMSVTVNFSTGMAIAEIRKSLQSEKL